MKKKEILREKKRTLTIAEEIRFIQKFCSKEGFREIMHKNAKYSLGVRMAKRLKRKPY